MRSFMMKKSLLILSLLLVLVSLNLAAEEIIKGDITCPWGAVDCNPCVSDVPSNFNAVERDQFDEDWQRNIIPVEARDGEEGVMPELTEHDHIQGMGRIPGSLSGDIFVFSRSHPAGFFVAYQIPVNSETGSLGGLLEPLIASDVSWPRVETFFEIPEPSVDHYGGFQLVGKMLFVGGDCLDGGSCSGEKSVIDIFDLSQLDAVYGCEGGALFCDGIDPTPILLGNPIHVDRIYLDCTDCVGRIAATKLADGRYLVTTGGGFIISKNDPDHPDDYTLDSETDWDEFDQWSSSELQIDVGDGYDENFDGRTEWREYQNINFVTECETGRLYLVGTDRVSLSLDDSFEEFIDDLIHYGDDWMDLFRVEQVQISSGFIDQIDMTKVGELHMYCYNHEGCNLDASGNIYVTPWRNLVMYASEKDDVDVGDPFVVDGLLYYFGVNANNDIYFTEFQNRLEPCPHPETDDSRCFDPWTTDTDTDGDGIIDLDEIVFWKTSPVDADTDHDGIIDPLDHCLWGRDSEDGHGTIDVYGLDCPSEASGDQQPVEDVPGVNPGSDTTSDESEEPATSSPASGGCSLIL